MLAVTTYLGLFSADAGPTLPVQAESFANEGTSVDDECVVVGTDGRVTVYPDDCVTSAAAPAAWSS